VLLFPTTDGAATAAGQGIGLTLFEGLDKSPAALEAYGWGQVEFMLGIDMTCRVEWRLVGVEETDMRRAGP
jgi:hypothetical protein